LRQECRFSAKSSPFGTTFCEWKLIDIQADSFPSHNYFTLPFITVKDKDKVVPVLLF
jgi:hypothetical protein